MTKTLTVDIPDSLLSKTAKEKIKKLKALVKIRDMTLNKIRIDLRILKGKLKDKDTIHRLALDFADTVREAEPKDDY